MRRRKEGSRSWPGTKAAENAIGSQRQTGEAYAGRIGERIGDRRCYGIDRTFALGFGAQRSGRVISVGKVNFGGRGIGKRGDPIVAQLRVDYRAVGVMNHVLGERPAESHGDGALDL